MEINFREVWRPMNRLPEEGQQVLVQCVWENGSVGYKECEFLDGQFVFFKPDGRGFYLTRVLKWIPMPDDDLCENNAMSTNRDIPLEVIYPYLLRDYRKASQGLKEIYPKLKEKNEEIEKLKKELEDAKQKAKDFQMSLASAVDENSRRGKFINELMKKYGLNK